jgi:hypothetical protein
MTTTETIGFCESVIEFMKSNKTALLESGVNVDPWIDDIEKAKSDAVKNNDEQEAMKAKLKEKTKITNDSMKKAYDDSSTKLDAIIGTLGKTTEMGKQAAKIRSKVKSKPKAKKK